MLVLGSFAALAEALVRRLEAAGVSTETLDADSLLEISAALHEKAVGGVVVIVTRDDALALRLALLSSDMRPDVPVWTTLFDATVMRELSRCAVVAAVTSSDLVNVEVGLAARDLAPGVPLVLRIGDGEVAAETDSLLHLGRVCDAHAVAADALAESIVAAWTGYSPAAQPSLRESEPPTSASPQAKIA